MTIQNPEAFCNSLWDWGILDGCFGETRIKPTDIDGFVERNGYFLFIEAKSPLVKVPEGQRILHDRLLNTGVFTIIILWGDAYTNTPTEIQLKSNGVTRKAQKCNLEEFRSLVSRWYAYVDDLPVAGDIDISFLNKRVFSLNSQISAAKTHLADTVSALGGKVKWGE